jgi:hypothetical protein
MDGLFFQDQVCSAGLVHLETMEHPPFEVDGLNIKPLAVDMHAAMAPSPFEKTRIRVVPLIGL